LAFFSIAMLQGSITEENKKPLGFMSSSDVFKDLSL